MTSPPAGSMWRLAWPAGIWAVHFAAVYGTAVVACGRWATSPDATAPIAWAAAVTVLALAALGWCVAAGGSARPVLRPSAALDDDRPAGRATFIATTTALLVLVAAVAVVAVGTSVVLVPACR